MDGEDGWCEIVLNARTETHEIDLCLTPNKPVVFHGEQGLSKKGLKPGQASYYYSITDLETLGRIRAGKDEPERIVRGTSWFDHEFGSNQLAENQRGWDWFSLHLSDHRDLMLYLLYRIDGSVESVSSGTVVEPDGKAFHLSKEDVRLSATDEWKSPRSGATYPSRWRILVPKFGLDLVFSASTPDQELATTESTGITYWEGAVAGSGVSEGREVTCEGYVELTGYAGALKETF